MARKRRIAKTRTELPAEQEAWLFGRLMPDGGDPAAAMLLMGETELAALWRANEAAVLAEWVRENPGTRPGQWWSYNAAGPRQRERVGGVGTPAAEASNYLAQFAWGIPIIWVAEGGVAYWNGESLTFHSGTPWRVPGAAVPLDPNDLPRFEAEATYLKRLGLLMPGEERRLKAEDFEPVTLVMEDCNHAR